MILQPDLIRVRRTKNGLIPLFAEGDKLGIAKTLIEVYREHLDKRRADLNESLASCEGARLRLPTCARPLLGPRLSLRLLD